MSRTRCRWEPRIVPIEPSTSDSRIELPTTARPPIRRCGRMRRRRRACGSLRFRQNLYSGAPLGLSRDDQARDAEALRLNAPATKQGAQAPTERPRLARLGVARARRAFAAGEF